MLLLILMHFCDLGTYQPSMTSILLIFGFFILGISLQRFLSAPKTLADYLNWYLIFIVLPALALLYLSEIELTAALLLPISSAYFSFLISWMFFGFLGKKFRWQRTTTGCLIIVAGLANTSFIGIPVMNALYGTEAAKLALLIDQAGSFIIVSSLAIVVASIYGKDKKRKRDVTKKILTFPPFIFFILAILLNILEWRLENNLKEILKLIAATLTPVALTAVGLQVKFSVEALKDKMLWYGLSFKLLLIPALVFLLYAYLIGLDGLLLRVTVMEMAMAPMITGSIIAVSHELNPRLANLLVGVGIPLSVITLAGWYFFLA